MNALENNNDKIGTYTESRVLVLDDENTQTKKTITTMSLVLMIITTVYGFGNVSVLYRQMTYAGICFFLPAGLMMAEYGSTFHDAKGGIYSWLAGSIGEKWAFIATFV